MDMPEQLFFFKGVGKEYTDNEVFNRAHQRILETYHPKDKKIGMFTICSWGKPYRQSYVHYFILKTLMKADFFSKLDLIVVTNAGVIPYELTDSYPYFGYDWDPNLETPAIKQVYKEVLERRLREFLQSKQRYYSKFCCYLRHKSESYEVIRRIEERSGLSIPNFAIPEREIKPKEYEEISLNFYDDHDIYLIVNRNLANLTKKLGEYL